MAKFPVLYQETRLSLDTASPSSILRINTGANSFASSFGAGRKRAFGEITEFDEESYARKHLATEGSVFCRPKSKAPRSFLWRTLDNRQVLEVQCIDLVLDRHHAETESWLTYQISLPAPIVPGGVALADAEEKDALEVFIITSDKELYTITLRKDLLLRRTVPTNFDSTTCVKRFSLNLPSYRMPYKVIAASSLELLISTSDGSILRLTRQSSENAATWHETYFTEGGLMGTISRSFTFAKKQTVTYGDVRLDADAVASMVKSPNGGHIWTVSLDHTLKAWCVKKGKVVAAKCLLSEREDEDSTRNGRQVMAAEQGTLLQIVRLVDSADNTAIVSSKDDTPYILSAYSPKSHQLHIFQVRPQSSESDDDSAPALDRMHTLTLPIDDLMNTNIWHVEQCTFYPGIDAKYSGSQVWLRTRSGAICKTFMVEFDLLDEHNAVYDLEDAFMNGWTAVESSSLTIEKLKSFNDCVIFTDSTDLSRTPSEKWLDFLFFPGRFSEASLETALYLYCKNRKLPTISSKGIRSGEASLKERLTGAIASKILLKRLAKSDQPDYDVYQRDLQAHWEIFYSLLSDINGRRHESIGFALDLEEGLAWTVCSDFIAPIRASSSFEKLALNANAIINGDLTEVHDHVRERIFAADEDIVKSQFLALAKRTRRCFSPAAQDRLRSIALTNALNTSNADESAAEGMQTIYDRCNFQDEIGESEYSVLNDLATELNGLQALNDDHFLQVTESIEDNAEPRGKNMGEVLGRLGRQLSVAVAQETLHNSQSILLDLLTLLVFLSCDLEDELDPELRPAQIYETIMMHLRHVQLRSWLVGHVRLGAKHDDGREAECRTLYEHMFAGDWVAKPDRPHAEYGLPELLTAWSKNWIFGINLSAQYDGLTGHVLSDLVRHHDIELALDFQKFLAETSWISYLRGRLYLLTGDYELAGLCFQEAVGDMASSKPPNNNALLDADEINFFNKGIASYYHHVSSLFDRLKIFASTAEFAELALRNMPDDHELNQSRRAVDKRKKSSQDSPAPDRLDTAIEEIHLLKIKEHKDELRPRLFNALNSIGHFVQAYNALLQIDNHQLQKSSLRTLLDTCIKRDAVSTLLDLPITGDLLQLADSILLDLAKRNMASGLPSGPPYHQILFAFRTQNHNYRGAAAILYEHLERLRVATKLVTHDSDDDAIMQVYVLLINTLACCGKEDQWLLADPIAQVHENGAKRKLVQLDDIRRQYVAELDRRSEVELGRFPLLAVGGEEDVDML